MGYVDSGKEILKEGYLGKRGFGGKEDVGKRGLLEKRVLGRMGIQEN